MKSILFVFFNLFLGLASTLFAQQNTTQLQAKLNQIKAQEGIVSTAYIHQLIALAQAYQGEKDFKAALGLDKEIQKTINRLSQKAPKEESISFNQEIENLRLEQEYTYWQGMMYQEESITAQTFLTDKNWIRRCVYNKNATLLLKFFELTHQKIGSEHLNYINNWEIAYLLYVSSKYRNDEQCEQMWQVISKHRIAEGKKENQKHLEVLFGYASFCKRTGKTVLYEELKMQVEKHWPFAFNTPSTKVDENINVSPSEITKENADKKTLPAAPSLTTADEMPRFPGCQGLKENAKTRRVCSDQAFLTFIYHNLEYSSARENGIESMAVVSLTVTQHGTISNIELIRDPGNGLNKEALRIVTLMNELPRRWKAGIQKGKIVSVKFNLPIRFKLQ
jgi:TonB family protein